MKKYFLGIVAAFLAVAAFAFTGFGKSHPASPAGFTPHFYELTNPSLPLKGASYMEITSDDYDDIACTPGSHTCKLEASSSSLPTNLSDANHDGIPDETGVVVDVPTKTN